MQQVLGSTHSLAQASPTPPRDKSSQHRYTDIGVDVSIQP